jgi:hypothetical protein
MMSTAMVSTGFSFKNEDELPGMLFFLEDKLMKREPRGKFDPGKVVASGSVELPAEQHAEVVRQIEIADDECRVNFRWGSAQLDIVKQVAEKMGDD